MNVAAAVKEAALNADFFDEKGLLKEYQSKQMNVLSGRSTDKPIMIKFGCGLTPLSFNRKLILQADTGADANAINKKTFDQLFPEVELEESTFLLQNFDKQLVQPIGSFRCFLRWSDHKHKARHAHKRLYTVLPKYSKIQVLPGITSCRLMKYNKQAIDLNDLLKK